MRGEGCGVTEGNGTDWEMSQLRVLYMSPLCVLWLGYTGRLSSGPLAAETHQVIPELVMMQWA